MYDGINEHIIQLLDKQINDETLSFEELVEIKKWIEASAHNRRLYDELMDKKLLSAALQEFNEPDTEAGLQQIRERLFGEPAVIPMHKKPVRIWRYIAAAAVVGTITGSIYLFSTSDNNQPATQQQQATNTEFTNQIPPGGDKAQLTLSNGSAIILDSFEEGTLAVEGSAIKYGEKLLHNYAIANNTAGEVLYNTLSTPRGSSSYYRLLLSDGTKVWLNPEAVFRFPAKFAGNERRVEVCGDAYFEVAKDASKPFYVSVISSTGKKRDAEIKVLGTHFNVHAYADDKTITTTLVEGSIQVTHHNQQKILKPAQAATLGEDKDIEIDDHADVRDIKRRREGIFDLESLPVAVIMKQVERMYNVTVICKGELPVYTAHLKRGEKLEHLMKTFNNSDEFTCTLEGETLTVTPK